MTDNLRFYPEESASNPTAASLRSWKSRLGNWIRRYRIELLLFLLLFGTDAYFYQSTQHNEAARLDQTRAIVQDHTLLINRYWLNTADVIHYEKDGSDHIYPAKAPGMSLIGTAPYAFWLAFFKLFARFGLPEYVYWHLVTYLTVLTTVGLLSSLAAVATYRVLLRATNDSYLAVFVVLALWLGTLAFPFSTVYFSHQLTAALLAFAFYFIFKLRSLEVELRRGTLAMAGAAGFLMGLSVANEYPAAILDLFFSFYFLWLATRWKLPLKGKSRIVGAWLFGGMISGAILVTYNLLAFGNPFYIAYEALTVPNSPFMTYAHGWVGFALPDWPHFWHAVGAFMIFPPVGLLYIDSDGWLIYATNPVLWMALPGLLFMIWKREWRAEGLFILAMLAALIVFIASYGNSIYDWAGAAYLGPRHIIPLLPFLALPLYFGARDLRFLFYPLLALSVFYMLLATAIEPRVPNPFEIPARDFLLPDYLHGKFAENTLNMFDPQNRNLTWDSTAFNLPKLAGVPGRYQLLPLMLWWLFGGSALLLLAAREGAPEQRARYWPRLAIGFLFLFVAAIAAPPIVHHASAASRDIRRGLLGKYYRNTSWTGEPVDVQVDPVIDFDWSKSFPLPAPFAVEWTGSILIEQANNYIFTVRADDGVRLEIDGRIVLTSILEEKTAAMSLLPGLHRIRVRYFNSLSGGSVNLWWTTPGHPRQIVPSEVLFPDKMPQQPDH